MKVPRLDLTVADRQQDAAIRDAVSSVLENGQFIGGDPTLRLERQLEERFDGYRAICCASGTDALTLALMAADQTWASPATVVTSALSFSATASAILRAGMDLRFVDIDPQTFLIDWKAVSAANARVVVSVHLYGRVAKTPDGFPSLVVEDACQAFGAPGVGRGFAAALSFFPSKPLGCYGDGGAVLVPAAAADHVRALASHGAHRKYVSDHVGFNSRLDTIQAAILNVKIAMAEHHQRERTRIAEIYDDQLGKLPWLEVPQLVPEHSWHCYVVRIPGGSRDKVLARLQERGIDAVVQYPVPLHLQPAFRQSVKLPHAEVACREILGLPIWSGMTDTQIALVISSVKASAS